MTDARQRDAWARTSSLMALVANTQRDPKKGRPLRPSDFDPFRQRRSIGHAGETKVGVGVLKSVFIDRAGPVPGGPARSGGAQP